MRPLLLLAPLLAVLLLTEGTPALRDKLASSSAYIKSLLSRSPSPPRTPSPASSLHDTIHPSQGGPALLMLVLFGVAAARSTDLDSFRHTLTHSIPAIIDVTPLYAICTFSLHSSNSAPPPELSFLPEHFFQYICSTVTRPYAETHRDRDPLAKIILQEPADVLRIEGVSNYHTVSTNTEDMHSSPPFRSALLSFVHKMVYFLPSHPLHRDGNSKVYKISNKHRVRLAQKKTNILTTLISNFVAHSSNTEDLSTALNSLLSPPSANPDITAAIIESTADFSKRLGDRLNKEADEAKIFGPATKKTWPSLPRHNGKTLKDLAGISTYTSKTTSTIATMILLFGISSIYATSITSLDTLLWHRVVPKLSPSSLSSICHNLLDLPSSDHDLLPAKFLDYFLYYMRCSPSSSHRHPPKHDPSALYIIEGVRSNPRAPIDVELERALEAIKDQTDGSLMRMPSIKFTTFRLRPSFYDKIHLTLPSFSPSSAFRTKDIHPILVSAMQEMTTFAGLSDDLLTLRSHKAHILRSRKIHILSAVVAILRYLSANVSEFEDTLQSIFHPSVDRAVDTTLSQSIALFSRNIAIMGASVRQPSIPSPRSDLSPPRPISPILKADPPPTPVHSLEHIKVEEEDPSATRLDAAYEKYMKLVDSKAKANINVNANVDHTSMAKSSPLAKAKTASIERAATFSTPKMTVPNTKRIPISRQTTVHRLKADGTKTPHQQPLAHSYRKKSMTPLTLAVSPTFSRRIPKPAKQPVKQLAKPAKVEKLKPTIEPYVDPIPFSSRLGNSGRPKILWKN